MSPIPLAIEDANYKMDGSWYSVIDGLACNKSTRATKGRISISPWKPYLAFEPLQYATRILKWNGYRLLSFDTVFSHVSLWLVELHGIEMYSDEGEFTLTVLAAGEHYDSKTWLGQLVTWHIQPPDQAARYFSGYIFSITEGPNQLYTLRVSSWLRFLAYAVDCRSFINQSPTSIVLERWRSLPLAHYDIAHLSTQEHARVPYAVQYNESTLAFTSRLLASSGIFYWVEYHADHQEIYLSDGMHAYRLHETVSWQAEDRCVMRYTTASELTFSGHTTQLALRLGQLIRIHTASATQNTFLIHTIKHHARDDSGLPGSVVQAATSYYANEVEAIVWQNKAYVPVCRYAKPKMQGVYVGKVVGVHQQEVESDAQGRVRVWFAWDRHNAQRDPACCPWLTVRQLVAGDRCGVHFMPPVGCDVVVMYVDDDVEQPVIIGSIYTMLSASPFTVYAQQPRSGFKTHKGHMLCLHDQVGSEQFMLQSVGDFTQQVRGDHQRIIQGDDVIRAAHIVLQVLQGRCVLDAGQRIVLRCGASRITITVAAIELSAPRVDFISGDNTLLDTLKLLCSTQANARVNGVLI